MIKIKSLFRFSSSLEINSYLANNLKKHELVPLKSCQAKAFKLFNEAECVSVNEIDGSGKTLAYLLPIMNHLLTTKQTPNAKRGAIILTLHKQLALSIYKLIRNLDPDRHLSVVRCGAITHYSPAIEQMCKKKEQQDEDLINQLINNNVSKAVNWKTTDILITTPSMLYRILSDKVETEEKVSPQFVVIDEADIILNKKESFITHFTKCNLMLNKLGEKQGNLRYIVSSAATGQISQQTRTFFFEGKPFAQTDFCNKNSIISKLVLSQIKCIAAQPSEQIKKKLFYLIKLMKERKDKRVIIFCDSKNIPVVKDAMVKMDIKTEEYRSKLSSQKRMAVLYDYQHGPIKILLTTDLCNRGITFNNPIDCIISFDMCSRADQELFRICRSNKQGGQYIALNDRQNFEKEFSKLKQNRWYKRYLENVEFKVMQIEKKPTIQ